jgi:hypothetical protein
MACRRAAIEGVAIVDGAVQSLLTRVSADDIVQEPFPHVVVHDALDPELCQRLIGEFPSFEAFTQTLQRPYKGNELLVYHASRELNDPGLTPLWRDMIAEHVSQEHLNRLLDIFADTIREHHASFLERVGSPHQLRAGIRHVDPFDSADVLLEAQTAINTPVAATSAVRQAHLDNPNKLIVGLYYLRHPDDESRGGDLELYRYANGRAEFEGHEVPMRFVEPVKRVRYERNTLVLFLNTPNSLHGVTPRTPTPVPRMFLNLGCEVERDLFTIPPALEGEADG